MKKKYGPLPLWAWGAVSLVAIYLYYRHVQSGSSTAASSMSPVAGGGIDPVTGVPYAQEEAAYQNQAASSLAPGSGGISDTGQPAGTPGLGQEIQDVTGLITSLQDSGLIPSAPGVTSAGISAAPTNQSAPTTAPSTNGKMSTGTLLTSKAIQAPFGSSAPPPKNGYTVVGTGGGNYQYVPDSLVTAAGGYLSGSISHQAPHAPKGYEAKGLGKGLWEIIPKTKPKPKPKVHHPHKKPGGVF